MNADTKTLLGAVYVAAKMPFVGLCWTHVMERLVEAAAAAFKT